MGLAITNAPLEADRRTRLEAELRQLSAKVAQLESQELEASAPSVRDEIGIDNYDKYLYKSGQSNRVAISTGRHA
jgi:hypothetical protein